MRLQDLAPRLARARDQWVAFENARGEAIGLERDNVWRLERLVAHRDLQLIRAGARRSAARDVGYMRQRVRKLRDAEAALARARRRIAVLEAFE